MQVHMLELTGSWYDDISVTRCICHEEFMHDSEEVITHQTRYDSSRIWCRGNRIGVIDEERVNGWISLSREDRTQTIHIQRTRRWRTGRIIRMGYCLAIPL